jgi:hypothetical protein
VSHTPAVLSARKVTRECRLKRRSERRDENNCSHYSESNPGRTDRNAMVTIRLLPRTGRTARTDERTNLRETKRGHLDDDGRGTMAQYNGA